MNYESIIEWLSNLAKDVWALIVGVICSVLGYFLPISNIVNLLIAFFALDMFIGYRTAKKLRGEKFSKTKVFNTTVPRMLLSVILIISMFLWDTVFDQDFLPSYKITGWFIAGVLLASIVKNMSKLTSWNVFNLTGRLLNKALDDKTGIDVEEELKKVETK